MKIIILIVVYCSLANTRVVELTDSNIPLLLNQSPLIALLHHPDCQMSTQYKAKYIQSMRDLDHQHITNETIGILDCSTYNKVCLKYAGSSKNRYPTLIKISQTSQEPQILNEQQYLTVQNKKNKEANLQNVQESQQLQAKRFVDQLKKQPNFAVILFEEVGMPTPDRIVNERVFYLENGEGKLVKALGNFVGNRGGCWIYVNTNAFSLQKYYCGDAYQSKSQLQTMLNNFKEQLQFSENLAPEKKLKKLIIDNSNFQSSQIMGYKELIYKLQHYQLDLQLLPPQSEWVIPHKCLYLYFWSKDCQFCDSKLDPIIIKNSLNKYFTRERPLLEKYSKYEFSTYDISENEAIWQETIFRKIMEKSIDQENLQHFYKEKNNAMALIPNLLSICYRQKTAVQGSTTLDLQTSLLNKIITHQNVYEFIAEIQENYVKNEKLETTDKSEL